MEAGRLLHWQTISLFNIELLTLLNQTAIEKQSSTKSMNSIYLKGFLIFGFILGFTYCAQSNLLKDEPNQTEEQNSMNLKALFDEGADFKSYIDSLDDPTSWIANYEEGQQIRDDLLSNARTIPQSWKLLAITEEDNLDAENTIPYIAQLVDQVHSLELRIVSKEHAETLVAEHQTYDGRNSTPLIIVLNDEFQEVGCWVERPAELQRWYVNNRNTLGQEEIDSHLVTWYQRDKGTRSIDEITRIVKAANSGDRICPVPKEGLRGR